MGQSVLSDGEKSLTKVPDTIIKLTAVFRERESG